MSLLICERCGYEAEAVARPDGTVAIDWPIELGASACLYAGDRRAAGEPIGKTCPWFEQEIAAAHKSNLLTRE